jgi:hypothetical protein
VRDDAWLERKIAGFHLVFRIADARTDPAADDERELILRRTDMRDDELTPPHLASWQENRPPVSAARIFSMNEVPGAGRSFARGPNDGEVNADQRGRIYQARRAAELMDRALSGRDQGQRPSMTPRLDSQTGRFHAWKVASPHGFEP